MRELNWWDLRIEEMERKSETMGFSWALENGESLAGEDAYCESIPDRLSEFMENHGDPVDIEEAFPLCKIFT